MVQLHSAIFTGFVGDMDTYDNPGYGFYHGPIKDLVEMYLPGKIIDMTDSNFDDMLVALAQGKPVWVIYLFHFFDRMRRLKSGIPLVARSRLLARSIPCS
ncbi:C39 family peptidase [Paenibacillus sp. FSL K6-2859]|uniref:C39 family peptidase n=1 Tax=Paenibacillus sp. FSL K6-2859 TaxID=2921482 RepID=UPI0030F9E2E0